MAIIDYSKRIQNLQDRRFDRELQKSVLSESFRRSTLPSSVKYLIESMIPIDKKYNEKTLEAAKRVQNHLESKLDLHFNRDYRSQGSVRTKTNIKVHSDFDLLAIINRYHYNAPNVETVSLYKESDPTQDIKDLRKQSEDILDDIYDIMDNEGTKSIFIFNKSLNRKVDLVFCYWYHTKKYIEQKDEYYRGIYLFDFEKEEKIIDYPFAHVQNVNSKGKRTNDGSRKGIRLLKTMKVDSEEDIKLSSFHLTTLVHAIDNNELYFDNRGKEVLIANSISNQLAKMISTPEHRKSIKSPNGTEKPFQDDSIVPELIKMKNELDSLLEDISRELNSPINKRELIIY